jgi:hypothetical protein
MPSSLAEMVLRAAHDLGRLDTAFDAEMLLSTLVGGVYAGTGPDRGEALAAFADDLDGYLLSAGTEPARVARAVLGALTGSASGGSASGGSASGGSDGPAAGPAWLAALGAVRATGGWACGDRYGDQTSYVVTFAYQDDSVGGPEHAVLVLVDHNLGLVKDLMVTAPAGTVVDMLRDSVATDPDAMTWLAEVDPATVRAAATGYLRATDNAPELPEASGVTENRVLVAARLAMLPQPHPVPPAVPDPEAELAALAEAAEAGASELAEAVAGELAGAGAGAAPGAEDVATARARLVAQFLQSPEARLSGLAAATGGRGEAVAYGLGLIVDFAESRSGDALRWSPRAVEVFLTDWLHGRAVLDAADARSLPDALGAWVLWSGRLIGLPDAAVQATFDEVGANRSEFVRLCATGERQSPAVRAMRRLIADAVDVTDDAAVDAWLRAHEPDD